MDAWVGWTTVIANCALAGVAVAAVLSYRREQARRREEQRVRYLLNAYLRIEAVGFREDSDVAHVTDEMLIEFDSAIAEVQLLGSQELVDQAIGVGTAYRDGDGADAAIFKLLVLLRADLRKELGLDELPGASPMFVRKARSAQEYGPSTR